MARSSQFRTGLKRLIAVLAMGASISFGLSLPSAPAGHAQDAAEQERIDAAIRELVAAVSRTELYLAWYDQTNRLLVAQGRMSADEADAALTAKAAAVTRSGFADSELYALIDQHREALRAWFASIEQAAGARPDAELWPGQAGQSLERLRREYESWVAERLDPLPLLEEAAKLANRAQGTSDPFTGQSERIIAAFPQPLARTVLGPLLSEEGTASAPTQAAGTATAAASGTTSTPSSAATPSGATAGAVTVTSASYGANCGAPDDNALPSARQQCDGKPGCDYVIEPGALGDPAPACQKDFQVRWTCAGIAQSGERLLRIPGEAALAVASLTCRSGGVAAASGGAAPSVTRERPIPGEMGTTASTGTGARPVPGEMGSPTTTPAGGTAQPSTGETTTASAPPTGGGGASTIGVSGAAGDQPGITVVPPRRPSEQATALGREGPLVIALSDANFDFEVLDSVEPMLVAFCMPTAPQCVGNGAETLETAAVLLAGRVKVGRLDIWQDVSGEQQWTGGNTFEDYGVDVVPTFILFDGWERGRFSGETDAENLAAWALGVLEDGGSAEAIEIPSDGHGPDQTTLKLPSDEEPPFTTGCTGSFNGVWQTNYGPVWLTVFNDGSALGEYAGGGRIDGRIEGETLVGRWSDGGGSGSGTVSLSLAADRLRWEGHWQRDTGVGEPGGIWYGSCEPSAPDGTTAMRNTPSADTTTIEPSTDRPGSDYYSFELPEPDHEMCQAVCIGYEECRAWTYVRPGVQGPNARCWLKSVVPPATPNDCCVSGVK